MLDEPASWQRVLAAIGPAGERRAAAAGSDRRRAASAQGAHAPRRARITVMRTQRMTAPDGRAGGLRPRLRARGALGGGGARRCSAAWRTGRACAPTRRAGCSPKTSSATAQPGLAARRRRRPARRPGVRHRRHARALARIRRDFDARAEVEGALLREHRRGHRRSATSRRSRSPPRHALACPSLAVGNFSWDWIYAIWPDFDGHHRVRPARLRLRRRAAAAAAAQHRCRRLPAPSRPSRTCRCRAARAQPRHARSVRELGLPQDQTGRAGVVRRLYRRVV